MSQSDQSSTPGGGSGKGLTEVIGSFVAVATLIFGMFTWWDARTHQKPDEPQVVAVNAPAPTVVVKEIDSTRKEEKPAPVVPDDLEVPHPFKTTPGKFLYLYRNFPLDHVNSEIEKVVIVIPAGASQAPHGFSMVREAAQAEGRSKETLVAVPIFREKPESLLKDEHLWLHTWDVGAASIDSHPISSFLALDELYGVLTNPKTFPNLRSVVLIGRHAGGIFVNHYVAMGNPVIAPRKGGPRVDELYVALCPGLLLYIDRYRPVLRRTGPPKFEVPQSTKCAEFNHYPAGLEQRPLSLTQVSDDTIKENLFRRRAVYIVGTQDTGTRGVVDNCAANLMGASRYRRNYLYWHYIQRFPEWKDNVEFKEVAGATQFNDDFYMSKEVRQVVFGSDAMVKSKVTGR